MVKVKICGLRRLEDIYYANQLQPDFIGFVFSESKRRVDLKEALEFVKRLKEGIKKVGVFVNEPVEKVMEIAEKLKLDVLQFHGDETQEYIDNFKNFTVWKAIRIRSKLDLKKTGEFKVDAFLFDSFSEKGYGGTGEAFDWNILKAYKREIPVVLSGGLKEENVEEAIKLVRPYAVDVSSGVEVGGYKDFNKMKSFIEKVRGVV
ncbi:phosphoribosylanthranilate isomerase [Caldanaerobacter subterraneus subsp. tengcongensis MB4]|uniref:N-(5'-phosphoribosyl)anthranilate isomerase n=1 Tax=Caldanaerobacter subterraneus subsp. tengcongensis (strain DSM 15242 / JCM 11007 / NBRC 100824 / MB4) TaxID=273068 RepID=TRPF_CALS4|nr:phosphoribosylanthranilate isomerase [Caldanaerobacter subterraneus]Q8R9M8.1 RecName: Full=N-(5'-phosphoribosyl)anthranilate isomerase; Short=PRAI [Caldanaerobacter subterraneus subsp. tengcongensis MB4]AAM24783.1 Phosphoribosylanthranilate isomerase [Caldanaerobacter subterraneus subsp. tengcongensis MB4]MCS3915648.1 phosphoribosylanthranilate isomerase [Caldanaerobacter subterraneus subsp. tengcongensis MB4]